MIPPNKLVTLHFTGRLEDGTVFDTSRDKSPIRYISNRVPSLISENFKKLIDILAKEGEVGQIHNYILRNGFGEFDENLFIKLNTRHLPGKKIGDNILIDTEKFGKLHFKIISINGDLATLDGNHPLAGKDLHYEIEIIEISDMDIS